jgi:hypothetical protein
MTTAEIQHVQRKVGTEPDGFWGPKSIAACRSHLRNLMPSPHPFPTKARIESFYGPHGESGYSPPTEEIVLPFTIYYEGTAVNRLRPHVKCAQSLLRVFERLAVTFPDEHSRRMAGILTYDGLYNPRRMRGGQSWSMHAWAIAIDLDADNNGNLTHWPTAARMPIEVIECFALDGWASAGAFWGRDAMHFEAVNPGP